MIELLLYFQHEQRNHKKMNFKEKLAEYQLKQIQKSELPAIAALAIEEGYESDSLFILAGLNSQDDPKEIVRYFTKSLNELKIKLPNTLNARSTLLEYFLEGIISGSMSLEESLNAIINKLVYPFEEAASELFFKELYALSVEYLELSEEQEKLKIELRNQIIIEAKKLIDSEQV